MKRIQEALKNGRFGYKPSSDRVLLVEPLPAKALFPKDRSGLTPIHALLLDPKESTADEQIKFLALFSQAATQTDWDCQSNLGWSLLHCAIYRKRLAAIKYLLGKMSPSAINAKDAEDKTALHYAVTTNNMAIFNLVIKHMTRVSLEAQDIDGRTALHCAVIRENASMMNALYGIMQGQTMNLDQKDRFGKTWQDYLFSKGRIHLCFSQ